MEAAPTPVEEQEIDTLLAAAGIVVPPDLRAGVLSEAKQLRRVTALVRSPRKAAIEPSNIFSLAGNP